MRTPSDSNHKASEPGLRALRDALPAGSPAVAGFRPARAALAIAAAFVALPQSALAQPAGAQVVHGQASFL
ncbi:MAG: hypothetical protein Q7T63_03880, partial [Burkholderiaceae bacterium]|nr:hypothetical protein [Burkholderiaceae bacterium]